MANDRSENSESGPLTKLRDAMHALTVELETHRTHVHVFMSNQDAINKQLAEIMGKQDARIREIEHNQIRHDERLGRVEVQIAEVNPKLEEMGKNITEINKTIAWWVGGGVCTMAVIQLLFQVIPMITAWASK